MKKICICTTTSMTLKSFVVETAKYMHKNGDYDITLVCDNDPDFAQSLPEYIHYIPVRMSRGIDFSAVSAIRSFYQVFKREQFDLIQYSTPNASCYASIAAKKAKIPIRLYCQWGIRYVGLSGISRKLFKAIEKGICKRSTEIRAVSYLNKKFSVEEGLYNEEKASVVGNGGTIGVDLSEYDINKKLLWRKAVRSEYGLSEDDFVFGFVGRISVDKGCKELLSAFRRIESQYGKVKLMIIGRSEDDGEIPKELMEYAKQSDNCIFTGQAEKKRMCEYYAAFNVLVHPTYREGFGMVLQEAGALGLGIITTRIPGASEVMEENKSCLLVCPKDAVELEKAMKRLIEDIGLAEKLGHEAYLRTKALYDRRIMLENLRRDYEQLLGE